MILLICSLENKMASNWNVLIGESSVGPLTGSQLKALATAGLVEESSRVQKVGNEKTFDAGNVKGLFGGDPLPDIPFDLKIVEFKPEKRDSLIDTFLVLASGSLMVSSGFGVACIFFEQMQFLAPYLLLPSLPLAVITLCLAYWRSLSSVLLPWIAVVASIVGICFLVPQQVRKDSELLAIANEQWDSGNHEEAVDKYKILTSTGHLIHRDERLTMLSRMIDTAFENDQESTAESLLVYCTNADLRVACESELAKQFLDRQAQEAQKQQVARQGEQEDDSESLLRANFKDRNTNGYIDITAKEFLEVLEARGRRHPHPNVTDVILLSSHRVIKPIFGEPAWEHETEKTTVVSPTQVSYIYKLNDCSILLKIKTDMSGSEIKYSVRSN